MHHDALGLDLSTDAETAALFDDTINAFLTQRADTGVRAKAVIESDPEFAMGHCMKGYIPMLAFKQALIPVAQKCAQTAANLADKATARERMHIDALTAWSAGEMGRALDIWETILRSYPLDILAFRHAHSVYFWSGRSAEMMASVERIMPAWREDMPGYPALLACRAFAHEECGSYAMAEAAGRRAIELDKGELWAAHAVAHVLESQGRRSEGITFLTDLSPNWEGSHNLQHHLWWHCALFHLEQGDHTRVLDLYDTRFRNLDAPLTQAAPDLYIDVQNAASMLYRLERQGVDVGKRWEELADLAETRIGDCVSPFTLPHWMMALTATGRVEAAERMIEGMRSYASSNSGTLPPLVRDYALPIAEAVLAHSAGRHGEAADMMRPVLGGMHRLGGSHAQQDVLEQLFVDTAMQANSTDDIRLVLERVAGRRPIGPERFVGWREAAAQVTLV